MATKQQNTPESANRDRNPTPIRQMDRFFQEAFKASDVAQALFSWDADTPAGEVHARMEIMDFDVAGVRIGGGVAGWMQAEDLEEGRCIDALRAFSEAVLLPSGAPLSEVIVRLGSSPWIFITAFGEVGGIITRADLQKAPVRMWLFGLVTLLEETFSRLLKEHYPDGSWQSELSASRLEKAVILHTERRRRNENLDLIDCLQFSDKGHILFKNEQIRSQLGLESRSRAKELIRSLERLRNHLAHSQDIVTENLDTIIRLATALDKVLELTLG